tara:strand:- start:34 stop:240 length:207 start_codon:yes stop_codon:yes gene_type:complete
MNTNKKFLFLNCPVCGEDVNRSGKSMGFMIILAALRLKPAIQAAIQAAIQVDFTPLNFWENNLGRFST